MWTAHHWQHWLDHGEFPDHPWRTYLQRSALTLKGLSFAPDRGGWRPRPRPRCRRRPGGERNWDYRYTWIRDSTFMLWGLYTLGFDWEANDFFYFIADVAEAEEGNLQIMYGIGGEAELPERDARPPDRLRGRQAGADRQRRLQPGPARRLGRGARLDLPAHPLARPAAGAALADHRQAGRDGARELARPRPRHLGGARRPQALHLVEADVLGGRGPRRPPRGAEGGPRVRRALAVGGRRDPRRHLQERDRRAGRVLPALRDRRARRLGAADPARALPAAGGRARAQDGARDRRRADGRRPGAALQGRGDRRRPGRRGGHLHDLLLLAGVRA